MASLIFPSAFTNKLGPSVHAQNHTANAQDIVALREVVDEAQDGGLSAFVMHVASLEHQTQRGSPSHFLGDGYKLDESTRRKIGDGASFVVDRAAVRRRIDDKLRPDTPSHMKLVVVKTVKPQSTQQLSWRSILFEIRTLLHEPLRFHPNIVRLLDIEWSSTATGSAFPSLFLEYAEFGTLDALQRTQSFPLPLRIKQKLCYDVARGLSILHACGVIHGDLKHENVLVFRNSFRRPENQPYTAKLGDFGGAVMDTTRTDRFVLPMSTPPFDAPEMRQILTAEGVQKTDVFSLGMLIWRCMVDCRDLLLEMGIRTVPGPATLTDQESERASDIKQTIDLAEQAYSSITRHFTVRNAGLPMEILKVIRMIFANTLNRKPELRSLVRTQFLLRGRSLDRMDTFLHVIAKANQGLEQSKGPDAPGTHSIDLDDVGRSVGRMGGFYDTQNNIPGYRSSLPQPSDTGYLFEMAKLAETLPWKQQSDLVQDLLKLSTIGEKVGTIGLPAFVASFCLFRAKMANFGTKFDAAEACKHLQNVARFPGDEAGEDYLAKAWLSRCSAALGIKSYPSVAEELEDLTWSILRGHRHCVTDAERVITSISDTMQAADARTRIQQMAWAARTISGGVGMPHFVPRKLRRPYNLNNIAELDRLISAELGTKLESALRLSTFNNGDTATEGASPFDGIYVNHKGHGLLHYASTFGNLQALVHLVEKYRCDINLRNKSMDETPLVCACRSGQYDCALFMLRRGADANGHQLGNESPLHWLSSFAPGQMREIALELFVAGADPERRSSSMRKDVRMIQHDWEDTYAIPLTPLGRAVLAQSSNAVEVLLDVAGSDPMLEISKDGVKMVSALNLACVLNLPDILEMLLVAVDKKMAQDATYRSIVYNECEMIEAAYDMRHTKSFNPLSLQSRIIRCGVPYKGWLKRTMEILYKWRPRSADCFTDDERDFAAKTMCRTIAVGDSDSLQNLLELGHDPNGTKEFWPLRAAARANNVEKAKVLLRAGAALNSDGAMRLLTALADRPQTSPPGLDVAKLLLGWTPASSDSTVALPMPLALAVFNRYFDLADFLLENNLGCDLSGAFDPTAKDTSFTLLGYLAQNHEHSSLESLEYLAEKCNEGLQLSPVGNTVSGLSVVHVLAQMNRDAWVDHSQISAQITAKVLEMFPGPVNLGQCAMHRVRGTALATAVASMHEPVLAALLAGEFRQELMTAVPFTGLVEGSSLEQGRPIDLVLEMFSVSTASLSQAADISLKHISNTLAPLHRMLSTISQLQFPSAQARDDDVYAYSDPAFDHAPFAKPINVTLLAAEPALQARARRINAQLISPLDEAKMLHAAQLLSLEMDTTDGGEVDDDDNPYRMDDLSVLIDEEAIAWRPGDGKMGEEEVARTMVKAFRTGGFGDTVHSVMDRTFNTRPPELRVARPVRRSEA